MWFFDTIVEPVKTGAKSGTAVAEAESLLVVDAPEVAAEPVDALATLVPTADLIIIDDEPMTITVDSVPDTVVAVEYADTPAEDVVIISPEPTVESLFVLDTQAPVNYAPIADIAVVAPEVTIARAINELSASDAYNGTLIQAALDRATALKAEKSNTETAHALEIERLQAEHAARMQDLDDQAKAALKEAEKIQTQGKKTARMLELLQAHAQS